jgi:hypothetical protein
MKLPTKNAGNFNEVSASINSEYVKEEKNDIKINVAANILIKRKKALYIPSS